MKKLTLRETQEALLGILVEFDRVCREHGLKYSLIDGTLLGTIRHKGFIPWDDDVDVIMPRPDYERFYELVKENKIVFSEHFSLSEDRGKKAVCPFLKLLDDRYPIRCTTHIEVPFLYLDIFPLDGMPDLPEKKMKKVRRKEIFYEAVISLYKWYIPTGAWYCQLIRIFGFWFYLLVMCYGQARACKKLRKSLLKYPLETSERVGNRAWGISAGDVPHTFYDEFVDVEFEGKTFSAIAKWDEYLTARYGDYMTPPKNQNPHHGMRVYKNIACEK